MASEASNNHETKALRTSLRRQYRAARQSLSRKEQDSAAKALVTQIDKYKLCEHGKRVAIYLSNDDELSTHLLIDYLWQIHCEVYLPVLHPFSRGHLLFLRYTHNTPMCKNKYGIDEPVLDVTGISLVSDLDIIFTPLVAFDDTGNRLGMGGGFYDRTLAFLSTLSAAALTKTATPSEKINDKDVAKQLTTTDNHPKVIGLAYDIQKAHNLPKQSWDVPLPFILTPTHYYTF